MLSLVSAAGSRRPLLESRVRPATLATYKGHATKFLEFCALYAVPLRDHAELDDTLVAYAELQRTTRAGFSTLLCAVAFFSPRLPKLAAAHAALKGWSRLTPTKHTMPMLRVFTLAIAIRLAALGWADAGSGLIVQHVLLLRPSELLALRREDVLLPEEAPVYAGARKLFLTLGTPAWGTKVGRRQVVSTADPLAISAMRRLVAHKQRGQLVFDFTYDQYRRRLMSAASELGLAALSYSPHSPRAGGATQLFIDGSSVPAIQESGRWASALTCKVYIDGAVALATTTAVYAQPYLPLLSLRTLPPALGEPG